MRTVGWIGIVSLAALAGCVTKGTFQAKEVELATCRTQLSDTQTQAKSDMEAAAQTRQRLEGELASCLASVAAAKEAADTLKAREADLRDRLQKELTDKDVEISLLKGQLSVRVLDRILFKSGSAEISPGGQDVLDKLAAALVRTTDMIRVEGHTDDVPIGATLKAKYFSNWELSAARAAAVVRYFQHRHMIDTQRLEVVGFAEHRPIAPNDSAANRQRNRRVEIQLTAAQAPPRETAVPPGGR